MSTGSDNDTASSTDTVPEPAKEADDEYEVEKVVNRRTRGGVVEYFVKWKGWTK
jgi:hypothetical protein